MYHLQTGYGAKKEIIPNEDSTGVPEKLAQDLILRSNIDWYIFIKKAQVTKWPRFSHELTKIEMNLLAAPTIIQYMKDSGHFFLKSSSNTLI